ncbi:hypothetical protein J6590_035287 [Homalodisca vitripennis]|nr:hypothetical protein J6590_035287 [Homalodisca vitripennis]
MSRPPRRPGPAPSLFYVSFLMLRKRRCLLGLLDLLGLDLWRSYGKNAGITAVVLPLVMVTGASRKNNGKMSKQQL